MRGQRCWGLCFVLLMACAKSENIDEPSESAAPQFFDVASIAGIDHKTVSGTPEKQHIVECNTGGAAFFD